MMTDIHNMSGKFLIAVPGLEDPNFRQSVVLICEHSREGAFGLIVNRILMNSFMPLLKAFDIKRSRIDLPIFYGGPVKPEQGYVIYTPFQERYGTVRIAEKLAVTTSKEILQDIAAGKGPGQFMFALGFAGWAPDQLEEELMSDSWLVAPVDHDVIFRMPVGDRWRSAACSIGVDFDRFFYRSGSS